MLSPTEKRGTKRATPAEENREYARRFRKRQKIREDLQDLKIKKLEGEVELLKMRIAAIEGRNEESMDTAREVYLKQENEFLRWMLLEQTKVITEHVDASSAYHTEKLRQLFRLVPIFKDVEAAAKDACLCHSWKGAPERSGAPLPLSEQPSAP